MFTPTSHFWMVIELKLEMIFLRSLKTLFHCLTASTVIFWGVWCHSSAWFWYGTSLLHPSGDYRIFSFSPVLSNAMLWYMWVYFRPLFWVLRNFLEFLSIISSPPFSVSSFWKPYHSGMEYLGLVVLFSYLFSSTFCIFVFLLYFLTHFLNPTFCINLQLHPNFLHICYLNFQMLVSLLSELFFLT